MITKLSNLSQRYIKVNGENKQEIFMIATMVREITKIDIYQVVEIGEYHSVVEYNMDRIIGINQGIMGIIEVILEEELLEEICDEIRIIEVNIQKKL